MDTDIQPKKEQPPPNLVGDVYKLFELVKAATDLQISLNQRLDRMESRQALLIAQVELLVAKLAQEKP